MSSNGRMYLYTLEYCFSMLQSHTVKNRSVFEIVNAQNLNATVLELVVLLVFLSFFA